MSTETEVNNCIMALLSDIIIDLYRIAMRHCRPVLGENNMHNACNEIARVYIKSITSSSFLLKRLGL